MKRIEAYIKPHKLADVTRAMHALPELHGITVFEGRGFGRRNLEDGSGTASAAVFDFEPHLKVEVFCSDQLVEPVVTAISTAAHTGLRGDGKVFISPVEGAVRISTGERGEGVV